MTEERRLTNTEMGQFRRCRRKWYLSTYRELGRVEKHFNRPLGIGSRFHDALEVYYIPGERRLKGDDFWQHFEGGVHRDIIEHPLEQEAIEKEADLCRTMLEGYFEWVAEEGIDRDFRVLAPESEMEVPLVDGWTLLSKIDVQLERISDGKKGNLEHKSVGSLTEADRRLQTNTQLLTEHLVQYLDWLDGKESDDEENPIEFVLYNMVRKVKRTARAKPPFFGRKEVRHNLVELRSHWRHAVAVARDIERVRAKLDEGQSHHDVCYPNPTRECTWDCDFADACLGGMLDDGSDFEAYLAKNFVKRDPLERYRGNPAVSS